MSDKLTEDADWRDGMNIFRLRVYQDIQEITKEIKKLKQIIKGEPQ